MDINVPARRSTDTNPSLEGTCGGRSAPVLTVLKNSGGEKKKYRLRANGTEAASKNGWRLPHFDLSV